MPSNNLALNVVKPCVRVGGSTVASLLSRQPVTDNKQHVFSDFIRQQIDSSHHKPCLSWSATDRNSISGSVCIPEPEAAKETSFVPLPRGVDIPTVEAVKAGRTLGLMGFEDLEDLSSVSVKLRQFPICTETGACDTVPVAGAAPLGLISEAHIVEEPPRDAITSGCSQAAVSQKAEKRRRAKANTKLMQLSNMYRIGDLQQQLKKYRTLAVLAQMRHQQQLVIRSWAALSARQRRDVAKSKQLGSQRKKYALRAIRSHLDHEQQLVLRSWSAVAADSVKTRMHQMEINDLLHSNVPTQEHAPIVSDCPLPPGLWNVGTGPIVDMDENSQNQSSGCSACLSSWGCFQHSVYSSRLFLAQRELGMKISRGPPGLTLEEHPAHSLSTHLRLAPLNEQVKQASASKLQRKKGQMKQARR